MDEVMARYELEKKELNSKMYPKKYNINTHKWNLTMAREGAKSEASAIRDEEAALKVLTYKIETAKLVPNS